MRPAILIAVFTHGDRNVSRALGLRSLGRKTYDHGGAAGEQPPHGRVEAWSVRFSVGHVMTWVVGGEQDGRFDILYPVGG